MTEVSFGNTVFSSSFICGDGGDGGGIFLACEDLRGRFDDSFPVCAFFKSGNQLCTPIPLHPLCFFLSFLGGWVGGGGGRIGPHWLSELIRL